jgi:hypothetical protein
MVKNSVETIKQTKEAKDSFIGEFSSAYNDNIVHKFYQTEVSVYNEYVKQLIAQA